MARKIELDVDDLTSVTTGGILAVLVIREVLGFLRSRAVNGNGKPSPESVRLEMMVTMLQRSIDRMTTLMERQTEVLTTLSAQMREHDDRARGAIVKIDKIERAGQ